MTDVKYARVIILETHGHPSQSYINQVNFELNLKPELGEKSAKDILTYEGKPN